MDSDCTDEHALKIGKHHAIQTYHALTYKLIVLIMKNRYKTILVDIYSFHILNEFN